MTGDMLANLKGRNISQWLMKTRDEYYKKRYGGERNEKISNLIIA